VPGAAQQVGGMSSCFGSLDSGNFEGLAERLAVADTASIDAVAARSLRQCDEGTGIEPQETKTCSGRLA
jgi:hypothetical protein